MTQADTFDKVKDHCQELRNTHAARNTMYNEIIDMFMLRWGDEQQKMKRDNEELMITLSPFARNQTLGAIRLMIATDPTFKVHNQGGKTKKADKLESAADAMFKAAGRLGGNPVHFDMILSGILFSEVHAGVNRVSDLKKRAAGAPSAQIKRLEEAASQSPYLVNTWDVREGYPEFDALGMRAFHRHTTATYQQLVEAYGSKAYAVLGEGGDPYKEYALNVYYDLENHWAWVDEEDKPIYDDAHGMDFIPIEASIIEGSKLFDKEEDRRQPFLYTLLKSGIWRRQNLMLTVMFDLVFKMGINPQFVFEGESTDAMPEVDYTIPGGAMKIIKGQRYEQMAKNVLDPSLLQMNQMANDIGVSSTIYQQALGQALTGSNATFSLQSLLSQAGRLPLVWPQKKLSWSIANVAKIMLRWVKQDGSVKVKGGYDQEVVSLTKSDIPKYFDLEAKLQIDMPQDLGQMAQLAVSLTMGDRPLTSKEYARDNYLKIGDSKQMDRDIWNEIFSDSMFNNDLFKIRAELERELTPEQPGGGPNIRQDQQQADPTQVVALLQAQGAPPDLVSAVQQGTVDPQQALQMWQMYQQQQGAQNPQGPQNQQGPPLGGMGGIA